MLDADGTGYISHDVPARFTIEFSARTDDATLCMTLALAVAARFARLAAVGDQPARRTRSTRRS